jgi:hypothetical protein
MTVVFFHLDSEKKPVWETDFITKDILPNLEVFFFSTEDAQQISFWDTYKQHFNNNIFIFTSNLLEYTITEVIVKHIQPLIIIHTSDEHATKPEYNNLAFYTKLLLRQYDFPHYFTSRFKNIKQIPNGWANRITSSCSLDINNLIPSSKRHYEWGFIGNVIAGSHVKWDRLYGIKTFNARNFKTSYCLNNMNASDIEPYYRDTIFTPSGRGNGSLECFRHYEASIYGVIPVVVGSDAEIYATFTFEEMPPWIFANTWDEAVEKCKYYLSHPEELDTKQQEILTWWKNTVFYYRTLINTYI